MSLPAAPVHTYQLCTTFLTFTFHSLVLYTTMFCAPTPPCLAITTIPVTFTYPLPWTFPLPARPAGYTAGVPLAVPPTAAFTFWPAARLFHVMPSLCSVIPLIFILLPLTTLCHFPIYSASLHSRLLHIPNVYNLALTILFLPVLPFVNTRVRAFTTDAAALLPNSTAHTLFAGIALLRYLPHVAACHHVYALPVYWHATPSAHVYLTRGYTAACVSVPYRAIALFDIPTVHGLPAVEQLVRCLLHDATTARWLFYLLPRTPLPARLVGAWLAPSCGGRYLPGRYALFRFFCSAPARPSVVPGLVFPTSPLP